MSKQLVNEAIKKLYVFDESLEEEDVAERHPDAWEKAKKVYGEWEKALRSNGINKRKIRERQRFMLYARMRNRLLEKGPEWLRPMNVDQPTKDKIIESFKTLKALTEIVLYWSPEKALYELRIHLLGGGTIDALEKENPILYEHLLDYYQDIDGVVKVYNQNFGTPTIELGAVGLDDRKKEKLVKEEDLERLAQMMVRMNYIEKKEDFFNMQEAQRKTTKDINQFLSHLLVEAMAEGKTVNLPLVYQKDPVMYFAIKTQYKDMAEAIHAMMQKVVNG